MMNGFTADFFIRLVVQGLASYFAICGFSVALDIPKRFILWAGLSGMIGWDVYLVATQFGMLKVGAAFWSSLAVVIASNILARKLKAPVTVFFVAGILPAVPGASIYRAVFYVIDGKTALSQYYLYETLQIAGAMALAIFIVDSILKIVYRRKI